MEAEIKELRAQAHGPRDALTRVERRLSDLEVASSPSLRTLPVRVDALESSVSTRIDQAMSAVGRMEILSSRLEESEESLTERLDILEARGEGLERRLKDATGAGGVAEWREEIRSLRKEMRDTWAAESAAQPWRDEFAALRDELIAVRTQSESGGVAAPKDDTLASALEELRSELRVITERQAQIEAQLDTGGKSDAPAAPVEIAAISARLTALESIAPPPAAADLTTIKGIGPKYARAIIEEGVTSREEVASLDDAAVAKLAEALGVPVKRVEGWRKHA